MDLSKLKLRADLRNVTLGYIRFMTMHDDGNVWIGAEKGLFVFRDNKIRACSINHNNASKIRPVDLVKDKYGYYWVGDFNYGLYRMRLSRASKEEMLFDSVKVYKCLKADSSFVTAWVQDLMMDAEGNVWYSSLFTGCYKLSIDNHGVNSWELFSNTNGLSSNKVDQIIQDELQNIWFCSVKGADCYLIKTGEFICFNKKDGLGDQVYDVLSINNHLYLEYDEGIMVINDLAKENKQKVAPKVLITGIMVNGNADSLAFYSMVPTRYKYNQNYISFDFTAISFKYEDVMQFQFMLEGLNKEWSELTQNRNISFSNLAPGKYCFLVRAKSPDGVMSQQNAMYSFIIAPPLYRTWWFIILAAIAFVSLVYLAYQYRIQQLLKVERLRTRIASDLHDDIGSTLSSISILSEILSVQLDNTPKSAEMIAKIGVNARTMLESMDDIIWSVNPSNDKFRNLILRVREYAIPLFESKQIKFHIQSNEAMDLIHLPMDVRRNMYLIAKEAVNNLIKYSCCKEARIEFYDNSPYFFMIISDSGIGFDQESPSSRNGLKNMKRRAEQIKADLEIFSEVNSGSTVKLKIKII